MHPERMILSISSKSSTIAIHEYIPQPTQAQVQLLPPAQKKKESLGNVVAVQGTVDAGGGGTTGGEMVDEGGSGSEVEIQVEGRVLGGGRT